MKKRRMIAVAFAAIGLSVAPGQAQATHTPNHRSVVVSFTYAPAMPVVNQVVTFTSGAVAVGQNNRLLIQDWDLDNDGAFDDGAGATVSRAFAPAGSYTVRHRAVDRYLNEAVAVQIVTVKGAPVMPLLSPFPVVQMAGRVTSRGTRIRLSVIVPVGATVSVRCRGGGCPLRRQTRTAQSDRVASGGATRLIRLRRLERRSLRRGAIVKVFVTKPGTIGKYARFKIRRGKPPRRLDACVLVGTTVPIACPTS